MILENSERRRMAPVIERRYGFFGGKSGSWVVFASAGKVGKGGLFVAGTQLFFSDEPIGAGCLLQQLPSRSDAPWQSFRLLGAIAL